MGCLFFIPDLLLDMFIDGMGALFPPVRMGKKARFALELVISSLSALLLLAVVLGLILQINDSELLRVAGRYMIFVPLEIFAGYILLCVILRAIAKRRK